MRGAPVFAPCASAGAQRPWSGTCPTGPASGANATALTSGGIAMSPVWNPAASHIAYMTMGQTGQQIVIREVGGATRILPTREGLNMTPTFSPDGNTIVSTSGISWISMT